MEVWKPIPSCPDCEASSEGRIRRTLKPRVSSWGYMLVTAGGRNRAVRRLVAEAFLGPSKMNVVFKNGDRSDNRISNLEYGVYQRHQPKVRT